MGLVSASWLYVNIRMDDTINWTVFFFELAYAFTNKNKNMAVYRATFIFCDIAYFFEHFFFNSD